MNINTMKWMRPLWRLAMALLVVGLPILVSSCGEDDDTAANEYENWKERNETYWNNLYKTAQANADGRWKILRTWSKDASDKLTNMDYVIAHVEEQGSGTTSPLYTDTVRIHYVGRLMPSASYPQGYQFDKSYTGDYDFSTMKPSEGRVSGFVDGFTTALLNMHAGDLWKVYIPYSLGYGSTERTGIPTYSTLIFDLKLVAFYRSGATIPEWKAKGYSFFEE